MIILLLFFIGLCIGSFLNVLIDRLPLGETVVWGTSHCDYCKKPLRWYELVPVFSFLLQGGRCRRCHKLLSLQYPMIELCTGFIFVLLWIFYGVHMVFDMSIFTMSIMGVFSFLGLLLLVCTLIVIVVTDIKLQIIPDQMLVVGVIVLGLWSVRLPYPEKIIHLVSAGSAFLFFYLLSSLTHGKGMGFGDVKLAAVIGFALGFPGTIIALYIAFLTGAMVGVILLLWGVVAMKSRIAFGPFLILGAVSAAIYGEQIISWWQKIV
jgi:prepilin signal peptidase PulO-like enzyme (type II secretory pathway)